MFDHTCPTMVGNERISVDFRVLGSLEVVRDRHVLALEGPKQRALLACLLLQANELVSNSQLVDALWAAAPPVSARGTLQSHVMRLRKALSRLGPDGAGALGGRLLTRPSGYQMVVYPGELDLHRFGLLVEEARDVLAEGLLERAALTFRAALALWKGSALEGVPSDLLQSTLVPKLEEQRLTVTEEAIDAELRLGRHAKLVAELEGLVQLHPSRERLQGQLMLALYRSGRQVEALEVYRRARRWLVDELGLEPSPRLMRLEQAVLARDPALDLDQVRVQAQADEPAVNGPASVPTATPPPTPAELPCDLADFTGREAATTQLLQALTPAGVPVGGVAVVMGQGGIGKTTLAVHVAHQLRQHFPDGQLFVNLQGVQQRPLDSGGVLAQFLRALGIDGSTIPDGVDERVRLYRGVVADRRLLVVLDNGANEAQVRPLLPTGAKCATLVTSRWPLGGLDSARTVRLDSLTQAQAVTLLEKIVGPERVAPQVTHAHQIARLCGLLPLAVRIAGAKLSTKPHWTLAEFAVALEDERSRLDALTAGDLEVRASLLLSYHHLPAPDQRAVALLGLLWSGDFAVWLAAAALGVEPGAAQDTVERLVDQQLLEVAGRDAAGQLRYRFHDLTRLVARELLQLQPAARRRVAGKRALEACATLAAVASGRLEARTPAPADGPRLAGQLGRTCPDRTLAMVRDDPLRWFAAERAVLVAAVDHAVTVGAVSQAWRLARVLAAFFEVRAHWDDWHHTHQVALDAARAGQHRDGEAAMLRGLGVLAVDRGHYDKALETYELAVRAAEELGDKALLAVIERGLADAYAGTGRPDDAITHYHTALAMSRTIDDAAGELESLYGLGLTYHRELGRLDEAAACLEHVLAITRGADEHRFLAAYTLATLGAVQLDRHALDAATACFDDALQLAREFGDPRAEAYAMRGHADALQQAGRLRDSEALLREVLALVRRHGEDVGEALTLRRLGAVLGELGSLDEAAVCLHTAMAIATAVGHRRLVAETLYARGVLDQRQGKLSDAAEALEQSLALSRQHHRRLLHAEAAHRLSQVLERLGHRDRARTLRAEALRIAPDLAFPPSTTDRPA